jgi:hypothetical protein
MSSKKSYYKVVSQNADEKGNGRNSIQWTKKTGRGSEIEQIMGWW